MANKTSQPTDKATNQSEIEKTDTDLTYDEVSIATTAGYRPMVGVTAAIVLSGIVLIGYPIYIHDAGDGVTLLTYTGLLWGAIITASAMVHEYYVTKNEDRETTGKNA
jgi:hypothetical protein